MKMINGLNIKNPKGFSIDGIARSVYVTLSNNKVTKTIKKPGHMLIDYDEKGEIVGVELFSLKKAQINLAVAKSFSDIKSIIPELATT